MERAGDVQTCLTQPRVVVGIDVVAEELGHPIELGLFHPEDLAHLAERGARAVADDVGDHGRAVTTVSIVDPLDDLLAARVLDVEVDVGRLGALPADEALEEKMGRIQVDRAADRVEL